MDSRHIPLKPIAWNEDTARTTVRAICDDALDRFDRVKLWPAHPADEWCRDGETSLYWGAAGVILALAELGETGRLDLTGVFPRLLEHNRAAMAQMSAYFGFDPAQASWLLGDVGILLLEMRLAPSPTIADELEARIAANLALPPLELMWGMPGTMLAAHFLHAMTGEARWCELHQAQAEKLIGDLHESDAGPIWTQKLYGRTSQFLGLAHGLAGNVFALLRGWDWLNERQRDTVRLLATHTLATQAARGENGVNWRADAMKDDAPSLTQICHGAPGMIAAFADMHLDAPELRALLEGGGEWIWRAGPLAKGCGFCHGTAGNGYALLKLYAFTRQPVWLERARAFAMNAIAQWQDAQAREGRGRYSLWTGDTGLAIFLRDCIVGVPGFPTLDVF
ncbi:MAG TPA: LanC-like protein [Rhizomicrobium sp.]